MYYSSQGKASPCSSMRTLKRDIPWISPISLFLILHHFIHPYMIARKQNHFFGSLLFSPTRASAALTSFLLFLLKIKSWVKIPKNPLHPLTQPFGYTKLSFTDSNEWKLRILTQILQGYFSHPKFSTMPLMKLLLKSMLKFGFCQLEYFISKRPQSSSFISA